MRVSNHLNNLFVHAITPTYICYFYLWLCTQTTILQMMQQQWDWIQVIQLLLPAYWLVQTNMSDYWKTITCLCVVRWGKQMQGIHQQCNVFEFYDLTTPKYSFIQSKCRIDQNQQTNQTTYSVCQMVNVDTSNWFRPCQLKEAWIWCNI